MILKAVLDLVPRAVLNMLCDMIPNIVQYMVYNTNPDTFLRSALESVCGVSNVLPSVLPGVVLIAVPYMVLESFPEISPRMVADMVLGSFLEFVCSVPKQVPELIRCDDNDIDQNDVMESEICFISINDVFCCQMNA